MVLDEADQMLERGFAESVEEVLDEVFNDSKNFMYYIHMCVSKRLHVGRGF